MKDIKLRGYIEQRIINFIVKNEKAKTCCLSTNTQRSRLMAYFIELIEDI